MLTWCARVTCNIPVETRERERALPSLHSRIRNKRHKYARRDTKFCFQRKRRQIYAGVAKLLGSNEFSSSKTFLPHALALHCICSRHFWCRHSDDRINHRHASPSTAARQHFTLACCAVLYVSFHTCSAVQYEKFSSIAVSSSFRHLLSRVYVRFSMRT